MGKNYDNWERLVRAVLLREQFKELSLLSSPSCSSSSSQSSTSELLSYIPDITIDHNASMIFFLDKKTGKNCFILGARQLTFSPGYAFEEWLLNHHNSRFTEVAKFNSCYMFLRGWIKAKVLSPETFYAAYLVFRLTKSEKRQDFGSATYISRLFTGAKPERLRLLLRPKDLKEALTKNIDQPAGDDRDGVVAARRDDGWMELKIKEFYVGRAEDGEVELRFLKIDKTSGLIVEGIEFRPMETRVDYKGKRKGSGKTN